MNKRITKRGGGVKSFLQWWKSPKNRQKVYDSDKADSEELRKQTDKENKTDRK